MQNASSKLFQTIACISIIFCMVSSTCYHTFSSISQKLTEKMLSLDLLGIGIMIFTLCITCVYAGYHAHEIFRNCVIAAMISIILCTSIVRATPCYKKIDNDCMPTIFYSTIIVLCLGLAISWVCYFATNEEV